jgi:LysR family nitrogen assimilation transcriptional regulator
MDTRRLAYYVTIVDCGTITRAADILHLAQPALSQHVSALENEFGQQLLVRSRKGVVPTAAGRSLYRYAQGILRLEESVRDEITSEASSPAGAVTIGLAAYSFASTLVVPILQTIRSRYPRIVTRVVETLTVVHSQALMMGQVDAAIIYDPGPIRGVRFERVLADELYLVTPLRLELPDATDDEVPLTSLASLPFMLPNRSHTMRKLIEQSFRQAGMELQVVIEMDHSRPLADAIQLGLGVTLLPKAAAEVAFSRDRFALRRVVDPSLTVTLALATLEHHPLSAAAEAVVDVLREVVLGQRPQEG